MMKLEWLKIGKTGEMPKDELFLLNDEYGHVYVGTSSLDYYDAEYWFPFPESLINPGVITNDSWVYLALNGD